MYMVTRSGREWDSGMMAVGGTMNDDQSPLVTLITCMVCAKKMKLETIAPDGEGDGLMKYHCGQCGRIERLRLARRSWP